MGNQTPREVLTKFYSDNNLGANGGLASPYVKIELNSWFHFYFPNFDARRKAVLKHDVHHILTEYKTDLSEESEISAWEIASGCKSYWAAFLIDTSGLMMGIPLNLWGTVKAFSRGRKTKNLYDNRFSEELMLDTKITELRKQLNLDKYPKNTQPSVIDFILFFLFTIFGIMHSIISLAILPFIILYSIYIELMMRNSKQRNE